MAESISNRVPRCGCVFGGGCLLPATQEDGLCDFCSGRKFGVSCGQAATEGKSSGHVVLGR